MEKETLLKILASYYKLIQRDNGKHPTVVLDDIEKSIKHVLKQNNYKI
jgi:hypothetical protein